MRHYQTFGDSTSGFVDNSLNNIESWRSLRDSHPRFSISDDRDEWVKASELEIIKDGQDTELINRASEIVQLLKAKDIKTLFSVGVGGAGLEYQIKKRMPNLRIICSEYEPKTVEKLKKVFIEADEIIEFDILKGDWGSVHKQYLEDSKSLVLMYRLDAGFDDMDWKKIFISMSDANISNIIYIPTTTLTLLSIWNRKSREFKWFLKRMPISFAGYLRTKMRFQSYWKTLFDEKEIVLGGLKSFCLSRKAKHFDIAKH